MANSQGEGGDKGSQGNNSADDPNKSPDNQQDPSGGDDNNKPDGDGGGDDNEPQYVTPSILSGVLDAQKRQTQGELKKLAENQSSLQKSIEALTEKLSQNNVDDKGKNKNKGSDDHESPEFIEMRRQLDVMKKQLDDANRAEAEAKQKSRKLAFETQVRSALEKAGCLDVDAALLVITPKLSETEDGSRIFSVVKSKYGEEDLDLDTYIGREFSENVCPYLFKGKMRSGSPAGGDGSGKGGYVFTREELLGKDPELYMRDPEKAREALEKDLVRGVKRGGSG